MRHYRWHRGLCARSHAPDIIGNNLGADGRVTVSRIGSGCICWRRNPLPVPQHGAVVAGARACADRYEPD